MIVLRWLWSANCAYKTNEMHKRRAVGLGNTRCETLYQVVNKPGVEDKSSTSTFLILRHTQITPYPTDIYKMHTYMKKTCLQSATLTFLLLPTHKSAPQLHIPPKNKPTPVTHPHALEHAYTTTQHTHLSLTHTHLHHAFLRPRTPKQNLQ